MDKAVNYIKSQTDTEGVRLIYSKYKEQLTEKQVADSKVCTMNMLLLE